MNLPDLPGGRVTSLFAADLRQDTFVITAIGDLGSLHLQIEQEMGDLLAYIQEHNVQCLLFDFKNVSMFGTIMLGAMVRIWKKISQRGGRMALCDVSEECKEILRFTKLHTLWPIYPSFDDAWKALHS